MRIGRTLPPAAAQLRAADLCCGVLGLVAARRAMRVIESEIRQHFGVRHVFLVSSGTAALTLTLNALAARSGRREVVVPAYTCYSVPGAVVHAGLHPVPCDISASSFDFDQARLEQVAGQDTLAVVVHHLFGVPSDVARTRALCQARGIVVVEDAAQGMGAAASGRPLGTLGDIGIFSFGRGKSVTAGGGGAIITNSDRLADAIRREYEPLPSPSSIETMKHLAMVLAMVIFIRPQLYWIPAALPFLRLGETVFPASVGLQRLSGLQAGLLRRWQTRLRDSTRIRSATAAELCRRMRIAEPSHSFLRLPVFAPSPRHKQALLAWSQRKGLGLSEGYPSAIDELPELRQWLLGPRCAQAQRVAAHLLTVPVHHWLSPGDLAAIADCLESVARRTCPAEVLPQAS
jgi:dTDP-4-amino-4,6-dideoxygalactose transaminase